MTTYKDLVDETINTLHGVVGGLEQLTTLSGAISSTSATSFTVDDAKQISRGLVEVDDELMWVKSVNQTTNTVTLLPANARGFRGSTAATHASGALVVNSPRFPRVLTKQVIQETLQSIYPEVYAVTTDETQTANASVVTYQVPAATDWIVRVEWQSVGPSKAWVPVRRWKFDPTADATAFPTGKSLDIYDAMVPGRTIKVTYAKAPGALAGDADTLASTGLPEGCRDVVVYGAAARLLAGVEAGRLDRSHVEQSNRDQSVGGGDAARASQYFMQLHLTRLDDERKGLQARYPIRTHQER